MTRPPVMTPNSPTFLANGGEMGSLMRNHDWSRSSLGAPCGWPAPLRTTVQLLLNTGHPMYIFWGDHGACLYNDAFRQSIGRERHPSSLGRPAREVWEEIWPIISPQIDRVMASDGPTWHENQLVPITRDGRREDVYWTYSYSPIGDDQAPTGVGGVLVVCTETTAQVNTERRLIAQAERQRRQFEQAPGFICILSGPEHVYEFANDAHVRLFGDRALGSSVREAFPELAGQGFHELLDQVFRTGERCVAYAAPIRFRERPGEEEREYFVDFIYAPVLDEAGQVVGIFCEGHDVTETHLARRVLAEEDRRRTEFLATLAHELRNPLAPLHSCLAVLRRADADPAAVVQATEVIERQVRQMTRLVSDLLDVARINGGKLEMRMEELDLRAVLANAVESSAPWFQGNGQVLEVDVPDGPVLVDGDPLRLAQVLCNLLHNASKFSPEHGKVRLSLATTTGQAKILVSDDGVGIDNSLLSSVFVMFSQLGGVGADRSHGGLGIGLSLVKRIIEMHAGTAAVQSEGLGRGSRFSVSLPLSHRETPASNVTAA